MKGSIRVSAKTVDDAVTEALIQLSVTSDRLEYEVIEKGSPGFLGIGMKQAVIEAWKKPEPEPEIDLSDPEPFIEKLKEEISSFDSSSSRDNYDDKKLNSVENSAAEKAADEKKEFKEERREKKNRRDDRKKSEGKKEHGRRDSGKNIKKDGRREAVKEEIKAEIPEEPKREEVKLAEVQEQTIRAVENFVRDTLNAMDMEVDITSSIDSDGALCIDMKGDHMGILIGKRGQTLDALQYLANRVANKHQEGYVRVKLDTENYRSRREETLKHLAKNIAHKVKRTRRPVALEPMNPYERRIIHSTLQSDPYVTTHSEGEEPYRKVVVTLKR